MAESSKFSCCLWGCLAAGAAVVLVAATVATLAYFGFESQASVRSRADAYLDALERGDWNAAYAMLSPEWQERMSPEEYARIEEESRDAFGSMANRRLSSMDMRKVSGRDSASRLTYSADSLSGPVQITVTLERVEGEWLIAAIDRSSVSADELPAAVACPRCGAVNPPQHNFCPGCGTLLRELEQSD